jgi:hypothetical protein
MSKKIKTRRSVLKGIGAAAIGINGMTTFAKGSSPSTIQVPKLVSGEEVYEYMTVEKDWYQHTQHATEARNRFKKVNADVPGIFSTSLIRSSKKYGGHNGLKIHVQMEESATPNALPSEFDGIPIAFGSKPEKHGLGCTNAENNTSIQGGELVGCPEANSYGSVCAPIHYNGNQQLLHCAHVFWDQCSDNASNLEGRTADVRDFNGNRTDIGTVKHADMNGDFVRIKPYSDVSPRDKIDDNAGHIPIRGSVTKATLDRWLSKSKSDRPMLYQMGVNTGRTSGRLAALNYEENPSCTNFDNGHGVYTWADFGQGDSGGPTYWDDGEYAWMVNITTNYYYAYKQGCNDGWVGTDSCGTGAYRLNDYGYTFGDGLGT